jgi:hypothetical protein
MKPARFELPHRQWPGAVLEESQVNLGDDNLSGSCLRSGILAQDFFRQSFTQHMLSF